MSRLGRLLMTVCLVAGLTGCSQSGSHSPVASGPPQTDLEFAKSAFTLLANGDTAAEDMLDWENFTSMGMSVGAQYKGMASDVAKTGFRKGFVSSFSKSFQSSGARAESLTNWRVKSQDANSTVVAADSPKPATLLITVSRPGGQQKLSGLGIDHG